MAGAVGIDLGIQTNLPGRAVNTPRPSLWGELLASCSNSVIVNEHRHVGVCKLMPAYGASTNFGSARNC